MSNFKDSFFKWAGVIAFVLVAIVMVRAYFPGVSKNFGAVSGMLAENYIPYILYNGGYNSALPLQTSSTITATGAVTAGSIVASSATITGNIIQTGASSIALFPGTTFINNAVNAYLGYSQTVTGNVSVTVAQWCAGTAIQIPVGSPALTITLPSATSTYIGCGVQTTGGWSTQLIDNESSNTVTFATTTGMNNGDFNFYFATGTPAVYPPKLLASSTMAFTGQYSSSSPRTLLNIYMQVFNRPF